MQNSRPHQLWGMIRYEALLQFRRRGAVAVIVFSLVALILLTLIGGGSTGIPGIYDETLIRLDYSDETGMTMTTQAADGTITTQPAPQEVLDNIPRWLAGADYIERTRTFMIFFLIGIGTQVILIALLPVMAETIPVDRHLKIRELIDSLPVSRAVYLAGKVLGAWLIMTAGWLLVMLIYAVFYYLRQGSYDVVAYIRLWLVLIIPGGLIMSGLTILLASPLRSRRVSVISGLVLIPVAMLMCVMVYLKLFEIAMPGFMQNFMDLSYPQLIDRLAGNVFSTVVIFSPLLVVIAILAWAWARLREGQ